MPRTDNTSRSDWRPGTRLEVLQLRALLLARIRDFFLQRGVLEVDTPHISAAATTDPAIESFQTCYQGPGMDGAPGFLHTSPEFAMKRLLAAGSGPIFQLCHVFRNGEFGSRHNPEFMLLEWYRPGFDQYALMDEVDALLGEVLEGLYDYQAARRLDYRRWFLDETGLDPWNDGVAAFAAFARDSLGSVPDGMPVDELDPWLDLLITHWLEPKIGDAAVFVMDYPPGQASLARVRQQVLPVAERFELYVRGMELANGFCELADAAEQRQRFIMDNEARRAAGQAEMPMDRRLLAGLEHGLPDCSGVAIGFDRLVMIAAGLSNIDVAMPFGMERA